MEYSELLQHLYHAGYQRVERDDRLQDVFPAETREKGVELWERWDEHDMKILKVLFPYEEDQIQLYTIARAQLENLLLKNKESVLSDFELTGEGLEATSTL